MQRGSSSRLLGAQAELYASLKLAGLAEAPVHLAVFVDRITSTEADRPE